MKKWNHIICAVGILFFIGIIIDGVGGIGNTDKWINFDDRYSVIFVFLGALALAFAKRPGSINDFLKYFSKASLICGMLGSLIGWINGFKATNSWLRLHEQATFNEVMWPLFGDLSFMAITMFYGLIFYAIANALAKD